MVSGSPGNIGHRLENVKDMYKQPRSECKAVFGAIGIEISARLSVNVLILDYRGYGDSEAKISISKSHGVVYLACVSLKRMEAAHRSMASCRQGGSQGC